MKMLNEFNAHSFICPKTLFGILKFFVKIVIKSTGYKLTLTVTCVAFNIIPYLLLLA